MNNFGSPSRTSNHLSSRCKLGWAGSEVIPDSEPEREKLRAEELKALRVIEISSESDSEQCTSVTMSPTKPSVALPQTFNLPKKKIYNGFRRVVQSSDEDSDIEIIKDTITEPLPLVKINSKIDDSEHGVEPHIHGPFQPKEDDGIIVFNEPRRAAKPFHIHNKEPTTGIRPMSPDVDADVSDEDGREAPRPSDVPVAGPSKFTSTPTSRRTKGTAVLSTPRTKAEKTKLDKQQLLQSYAERLFADLNKTVFKDGLPMTTELRWNKRLLKTAGRAKYHRSRDGVETIEIELAEKILDCEERIRNTLSHEMCHLATWIIDGKIDEHHGNLFMKWAGRVMKKHPHIHVSVRHDYEISYPFVWKCEQCDKTYGRFSKSIRPDECVCGACREGKLIPLFTSKRTKRATKISKFAATNAQDSPRTLPNPASVDVLTDTESADSEVEVLAGTLAATSITL